MREREERRTWRLRNLSRKGNQDQGSRLTACLTSARHGVLIYRTLHDTAGCMEQTMGVHRNPTARKMASKSWGGIERSFQTLKRNQRSSFVTDESSVCSSQEVDGKNRTFFQLRSKHARLFSIADCLSQGIPVQFHVNTDSKAFK